MSKVDARAVLEEALQDKKRLDEHAPTLYRMSGTMILIGALLSALALIWQPGRFWSAYLTGYSFLLSITLGAMFFVLIQHLTKAGWSVTVRRVSEALMMNIGLCAILVIPILIGMWQGKLTPAAVPQEHAAAAEHATPAAEHAAPTGEAHRGDWTKGPHLEGAIHPNLAKAKAKWLSLPWVITRLIICFAIWIVIAGFYYRSSVAQDETKDLKHTQRMQFLSAPCVLVFSFTASIAAFDLLMALDPYWYSTIFGVYFWAGGFLAFNAALILALVAIQRAGIITKSVNAEHYQDVGKFMFAWIVFWAYIAYSQYMLIWYGNIPEETAWFLVRQEGPWAYVSGLGLVIGHFVVPFFLLMSRFPKRRPKLLALGALYVLFIHFIDMFWLVAPQKSPLGTMPAPLLDVFLLIALVGAYVASTVRNMKGVDLIPSGDPRLPISLLHENY